MKKFIIFFLVVLFSFSVMPSATSSPQKIINFGSVYCPYDHCLCTYVRMECDPRCVSIYKCVCCGKRFASED